jgi:hypothetical protein
LLIPQIGSAHTTAWYPEDIPIDSKPGWWYVPAEAIVGRLCKRCNTFREKAEFTSNECDTQMMNNASCRKCQPEERNCTSEMEPKKRKMTPPMPTRMASLPSSLRPRMATRRRCGRWCRSGCQKRWRHSRLQRCWKWQRDKTLIPCQPTRAPSLAHYHTLGACLTPNKFFARKEVDAIFLVVSDPNI